MKKTVFFIVALLTVFVFSQAQAQVGTKITNLKDAADSTTTFKVGPVTTTATSQVFDLLEGPASMGYETPDVITFLFDINSLNDSTNVVFKLDLSSDGTTFFEQNANVSTTVVSGTADTDVFVRATTIPGFPKGRIRAVAALPAGDSLNVTIQMSREWHN